MSNSRKHRSEDSKWWKSERKEAHSLRLHGVNLRVSSRPYSDEHQHHNRNWYDGFGTTLRWCSATEYLSTCGERVADFEKPVLAEHGPQLPLRPPHLSFVYHSPRPCPLSGRRLEVIYINGAQANSKDRRKGIAGRSSKTE
ncbi:hypothetical protein BHE74_00023738 [Ensete ventricosum]|nr:hypothetical protein BHE74_00023738 [Ensete ventricosum]